MRILIVSHDYPSITRKAARGFVHARAKMYVKTGNRCKVFVPSGQGLSTYTHENVDVIRAPINNISNIVKVFDPDIIAAHSPTGRWLIHLSRIERPLISYIHGAEALLRAFSNYYSPFSLRENILKVENLFYDPIKRILLRRFLQMSTAVVYVSRWLKKTAEKYVRLRHPLSFVIPNSVDTELFKPNNIDILSRAKKGISVRDMMWQYGLDIAIKAFSNLQDAHLTIVGRGPLERYLRKLANVRESNVIFVTKRFEHEKLPEVYNSYGYFVAPSRTESQGLAMCESMACGLPVIATNVGGIPEFISDGFNGFLVTPEDPSKLRNAVKLLISNDRLHIRLSENARRFVEEHLSHKTICSKETEVFKRAQEAYKK